MHRWKFTLWDWGILIYKHEQIMLHYLWSNEPGQSGSNQIGSYLLHHLWDLLESIKKISIFSDTCSGQNRNQNTMVVKSIGYLKITKKKFLEKNHRYMEHIFNIWLEVNHWRIQKRPYKLRQLSYNDYTFYFRCKEERFCKHMQSWGHSKWTLILLM